MRPTVKKSGGLLVPSEHDSQAAFFAWWKLFSQSLGIPERLCFAIPNGAKLPWRRNKDGKRYSSQAVKLKEEGLRPGVSDVMLAIPSGGFHGLFMEFKRRSEKPTEEQVAFLFDVRGVSYNALVVWSTDEAMRAVTAYLFNADPAVIARFPQLSRLKPQPT